MANSNDNGGEMTVIGSSGKAPGGSIRVLYGESIYPCGLLKKMVMSGSIKDGTIFDVGHLKVKRKEERL